MAGTITNYTIPKVTRYKAVWTPFPLPHCWVNRIKVQSYKELECGPMPNVMVALQNIGGAFCSTPQSLADAQYWSAVQ